MERKRIFIVDDSEYIATTLKKILDNLDYEVIGYALSEEEALTKIQLHKDRIDLITLDIFLGKSDGIALIPEILKIKPELKIVMVSSNKEQKAIIKSIQMGAKHYILKPFNIEDVRKILQQVFR